MVTRVNRVFITKENPVSVLLVIAHSPYLGSGKAQRKLEDTKESGQSRDNPFAGAFGGSLGASWRSDAILRFRPRASFRHPLPL